MPISWLCVLHVFVGILLGSWVGIAAMLLCDVSRDVDGMDIGEIKEVRR